MFLFLVVFSVAARKSPKKPIVSVPDVKPLNSTPPDDAISVVTKYTQARENANGADQATPTSWLATVQPLTTPEWFSELQPVKNSPTSNIPRDFTVAHNNHYIIKATVSGCFWNLESQQPTDNSGVMYCNLTDTTVDLTTNTDLPATSLPFGWSANGPQLPAIFDLVKQNGKWLISEDATGQD